MNEPIVITKSLFTFMSPPNEDVPTTSRLSVPASPIFTSLLNTEAPATSNAGLAVVLFPLAFTSTLLRNEPVPSSLKIILFANPFFMIKLSPLQSISLLTCILPPNEEVPIVSRLLLSVIAPPNDDAPPTSRVALISILPPKEPLPSISILVVPSTVSLLIYTLVVE